MFFFIIFLYVISIAFICTFFISIIGIFIILENRCCWGLSGCLRHRSLGLFLHIWIYYVYINITHSNESKQNLTESKI